MRLIDDDEVERLGRKGAAVGDGDRGVGDEVVEVGVVLVGDLPATQNRVHALDRGDDHVGGAEHPGAGEVVDVVDFGEPAPVAGRAVVLELGDGLLGQVVAIDEEQEAAEPAVLETAVCRGHRSERLACAGGHLDQGPVEVLVGQTLLDALDRSDLSRPERCLVER